MDALRLTIQTPTQQLFDGNVDSVRLKNDLGRLEILPNHTTLVGTLLYSKVHVRTDNTEEVYIVRHGSVTVDQEGDVRVLGLEAHKVADMTIENMQDYLEQLKVMLDDPGALNEYQQQFLQEQRDALQEGIEDKD